MCNKRSTQHITTKINLKLDKDKLQKDIKITGIIITSKKFQTRFLDNDYSLKSFKEVFKWMLDQYNYINKFREMEFYIN